METEYHGCITQIEASRLAPSTAIALPPRPNVTMADLPPCNIHLVGTYNIKTPRTYNILHTSVCTDFAISATVIRHGENFGERAYGFVGRESLTSN